MESSHRIQMIQNSFGTTGKRLNTGERSLLAEGILLRRGGGRINKRHFFLFDDLLVWGSVVRENINNIRQRTIPLESIQIEDIKNSNAWKISCPGNLFSSSEANFNFQFQRNRLSWKHSMQMKSANGCCLYISQHLESQQSNKQNIFAFKEP